MALGDRIRMRREELGLTQLQLAQKIGVEEATISRYESGSIKNPPQKKLHKIIDVLGVDANFLILWSDEDRPLPSNIIPMPKMVKVPLLGTIACGDPILAIEETDEYVDMPEDVRGDFALTCKGDSMIGAYIYDGDIVFIRQQNDVANGEIAAVLYNDENEATLKRVYKIYQNGILVMVELRPENPTIKPRIIQMEDLENLRIMGKAVNYLGKVR